MFASVGRRLAILNALVVLGILALISIAVFLFLQRSLEAEVDRSLQDRAAAAQLAWEGVFRESISASGPREIAALVLSDNSDDEQDHDEEDDDREEHEEEHNAAEELIESGDTIAYALAPEGEVLADARGVPVPGLPALAPLDRAISGSSSTIEMTIEGETVRVYTEPAWIDGQIAGAVQVAQGQGENEAVLRTVRLATLGGLALGAVVAIPAGLFLANRSMRPIRHAFDQQKMFVADASHELRTPLTVLRAQAEYLERTPDLPADEIAAGHAELIREVDAMSLLVNDLLLLARADNAALTLDRGEHDLTAIATQAVGAFGQSARDAGITLTIDADGPVVATVDPERMQQVIRILVDNGLSHTPAGGSVTVGIEDRPSAVRLTVADSGSGIDPADLPHIFDRFYRAEKARTKTTGGTGLGLAIARSLVEAHGGSIRADSTAGAGATFTVTLPRHAGRRDTSDSGNRN